MIQKILFEHVIYIKTLGKFFVRKTFRKYRTDWRKKKEWDGHCPGKAKWMVVFKHPVISQDWEWSPELHGRLGLKAAFKGTSAEERGGWAEALSPAGSHRKTICQSRQFFLWLERPEFLQSECGLLDSETCNEAHEKSGFTTQGLEGFEPWTLRCEGASCLCPACTRRSF